MLTSRNNSKRTKVFVSYSRADKNELQQFQTIIRPLEREGLVDLWDDTKIPKGANWKEEIEKALEQAKVAVFLVSANFLASDFIDKEELPKLLSASEGKGLTILPFFLSHCYYQRTPLAKYQAVNNPDKPLSDFEKSEQTREWVNLVREIDAVLMNLDTQSLPKLTNRLEANKIFTESLGIGVEIEMISIPGDFIWMGSPENEEGRYEYEGPHRPITISPFRMGKYPVTQKQWMKVSAYPKVAIELKPQPSEFIGENRPVECISWHEAIEFCARLSKQTGNTYRLPSEAEWEYACRAGTTTRYYFGQDITSQLANYEKFFGGTTDVGKFLPNTFGLRDMHGNVWEWCADHWHDNYEGAPTGGTPWTTGGQSNLRVLRGGSWSHLAWDCRSASRNGNGPGLKRNNVGFRVACSST